MPQIKKKCSRSVQRSLKQNKTFTIKNHELSQNTRLKSGKFHKSGSRGQCFVQNDSFYTSINQIITTEQLHTYISPPSFHFAQSFSTLAIETVIQKLLLTCWERYTKLFYGLTYMSLSLGFLCIYCPEVWFRDFCDQILFSIPSIDKAVLRQQQKMLDPSVVSKVSLFCLGLLKTDWRHTWP